MSNNHRLTEREKINILRDLGKGMTQSDIGVKYGCNHSSVSRLNRRFQQSGSIQNKKSTGRKRTFNDQDVLDMKNIALNNSCKTIDDIRRKYEEYYTKRFNNSTVRRILKEAGLKYRRKAQKWSRF
ncbi:hypothetical protein CYY_002185 [Polysphondylium violaceum]|uniref:Transposase Tc1-like domain-containing protein n=1 Tax=Polysphondylium violaceum TaxID=133409 RepID=A0A8J4Q0L5_9MYCE|nr:hypothetical protein CYY_002185 [Polysphondylium violaceum]